MQLLSLILTFLTMLFNIGNEPAQFEALSKYSSEYDGSSQLSSYGSSFAGAATQLSSDQWAESTSSGVLSSGNVGSSADNQADAPGSSDPEGSSEIPSELPDYEYSVPAELAHTPHIVEEVHREGNVYDLFVWSPANQRVVHNEVIRPDHDNPRPTFYMLPGWEGGTDGHTWTTMGGAAEYFEGVDVNIVQPLTGTASLFADWERYDPNLGLNLWETYLTEELAPLIDETYNGTGRDGVMGLSMTGGQAVAIAAKHPDRFVTTGSISGCPSTTNALGAVSVQTVINRGEGSSTNAFGAPSSYGWQSNDPMLLMDGLQGQKVYVASATGIPGEIDGDTYLARFGSGQLVEAVSNSCTRVFVDRANQEGIDVTWYQLPNGAHTWPLFVDEFYYGWETVFAPALGVEVGAV